MAFSSNNYVKYHYTYIHNSYDKMKYIAKKDWLVVGRANGNTWFREFQYRVEAQEYLELMLEENKRKNITNETVRIARML